METVSIVVGSAVAFIRGTVVAVAGGTVINSWSFVVLIAPVWLVSVRSEHCGVLMLSDK